MNNVSADLASEAKEKKCSQLVKEGILDKTNQSLLFDKGDRDVNCGYMVTYSKGFITSTLFGEYGCAILQIAYNKDGSDLVFKTISYASLSVYSGPEYSFSGLDTEGAIKYLASLEGACPISVYYVPDEAIDEFKFGEPISIWDQLSKFRASNKMENIFSTQLKVEIPPLIITDPNQKCKDKENCDCEDIIGEKGVSILKTIKNIITIAIPILLVVLGSLDLIKAIFSNDDGEMKKAQSKLIKRVIIAVIILLAPIILKIILEIAHKIWPSIDASLCGIYD